jgi:CheY-like chemotaxis protein
MSKRILVVEDQPDNRQIIRDMLASEKKLATAFCNKIGPKRARRSATAAAAFGGKADIQL